MRALLGVLLVGATALIAGAIGYQVGVSSAVATTAAAGGTVVYHAAWGFGFPWFGFLFFPLCFFLFFGLIAFAFGGRRRWGGGPGGPGWGYGNGYTPSPDDPRYRYIADAHRRLHEDEAAGRTPSGPTPPAPPAGG
jgi:hypothetical protein